MNALSKNLIIFFTLLYTSMLNADVQIPNVIYFDNDTTINFDVKISGMPGKPIPAKKTNYVVSYLAVITASEYKGTTTACELQFYDKANGNLVASAVIDVYQAKIISPPIFYGAYQNQYAVYGWDNVPISRIKIGYLA